MKAMRNRNSSQHYRATDVQPRKSNQKRLPEMSGTKSTLYMNEVIRIGFACVSEDDLTATSHQQDGNANDYSRHRLNLSFSKGNLNLGLAETGQQKQIREGRSVIQAIGWS